MVLQTAVTVNNRGAYAFCPFITAMQLAGDSAPRDGYCARTVAFDKVTTQIYLIVRNYFERFAHFAK